MAFCRDCGNELPSYAASFCPECGTSIKKDNSGTSKGIDEESPQEEQRILLEKNKMQAVVSTWVTYDVYETKDVDIFVRKLSKDLYKIIIDDADYEEEEHYIRKTSLDRLFEEYGVDPDDETDVETRLEKTGEVVNIPG